MTLDILVEEEGYLDEAKKRENVLDQLALERQVGSHVWVDGMQRSCRALLRPHQSSDFRVNQCLNVGLLMSFLGFALPLECQLCIPTTIHRCH